VIDVNITSCGKWILAGEHSVLRGCDALVFPLESRRIRMFGQVETCARNHGTVHFVASGELEQELPSLFMAVLNRAYDLLPEKNIQIRGQLNISNELAFGAGLGASASVCVLITNLLFELKMLHEHARFQFARQLENIFHGESSGVDIAVTLVNKPIRFNRDKGYEILKIDYRPQLTLHYTGKRGVTRECIEVVKNVFKKNPAIGASLDDQMALAVKNCESALQTQDEGMLAEAIELASKIYQAWGLIDPLSDELIKSLKSAGARAVKPTGSGLGGYVLALWPCDSQAYLKFDGIPVFSPDSIKG